MTTFDKSTSIGFIGAGAVGGSLAGVLHDAGYPVVAVASRTFASAGTFASRIPGCVPYRSLQKLVDSVGFVFITTSDDAIGTVCESLRWREGQGVAHCSGAASLEPLQSAVESGAVSGAFHPLQAFSSVEEGVENIPGTTFGIEAGPELHDYLERIRAGGVIEKLIYGSDGPQLPGYVQSHLDAFVAGMTEVGYTTDEMRLILADNFTRVFGMPRIVLQEQ